MGGFTKIYPLGEETQWYDPFLITAKDAYIEYENQIRLKIRKLDAKTPFSVRTKKGIHTDSTSTVMPIMN